MQFILNHLYLLLAIFFGVVSQLIIKWQMSAFSFNDYETWQDKFALAFSMLLNPYIIISLILTYHFINSDSFSWRYLDDCDD